MRRATALVSLLAVAAAVVAAAPARADDPLALDGSRTSCASDGDTASLTAGPAPDCSATVDLTDGTVRVAAEVASPTDGSPAGRGDRAVAIASTERVVPVTSTDGTYEVRAEVTISDVVLDDDSATGLQSMTALYATLDVQSMAGGELTEDWEFSSTRIEPGDDGVLELVVTGTLDPAATELVVYVAIDAQAALGSAIGRTSVPSPVHEASEDPSLWIDPVQGHARASMTAALASLDIEV